MHEALHLRGLGAYSSEPAWAFSDDSEILCEEGRIAAIGDTTEARVRSLKEQGVTVRVLDGDGLVALPGLIDGHVHPVAGSTSVPPAGTDWTHCYLNAGVTACVSAGELTVPGFSARSATPDAVTRLATTSAWCFGNIAALPPGLPARSWRCRACRKGTSRRLPTPGEVPEGTSITRSGETGGARRWNATGTGRAHTDS